MKNYYEILEVDVHASHEIIEKAFKVLAKRYHPDTQSEDKKEWAETKFKEINEAYEVLSNENARSKYDIELDSDKSSVLEAICAKNNHLQHLVEELQNELEYVKSQTMHNSNINQNQFNMQNKNYDEYEEIYHNSPKYVYSQPPHSNYNTISKDETVYYVTKRNLLKDLFSFVITILFIIIISFILWKIPFTNKLLTDLYNNNPPIKALVDFFLRLFSK